MIDTSTWGPPPPTIEGLQKDLDEAYEDLGKSSQYIEYLLRRIERVALPTKESDKIYAFLYKDIDSHAGCDNYPNCDEHGCGD
jgi:hypothetical protein